MQKEIVGVTLRKHLRGLGEQQADYEETGRVVVPPEVMRQLNDILLKSLQMAIRTTSFPREDLPYGITYRRSEKLPEMRQPQEGEGVMPEVIGENALDNIMVGEDNRLWLTDCAAVCVADKDLAEDGTWRQLHRGLYQYGTDKLLSDEVRQYTHELDRALKGEPLRFLNA